MPVVENVPRALAVATFLLSAGCNDLKRAEPATDAEASADASADANVADAAIPDGHGPGPHGSLPSGYCCTSDSECRDRHCVQVGGSGPAKTCLDECTQDRMCTRPGFAFVCDPAGSPRLCRPQLGFSCIDPAKFTRGERTLGACCNVPVADPDGTAGSECEGNLCTRGGTGPIVCSHRCASQNDCPGDFACLLLGTSSACVPGSSDYACF